MYYTLYKGCAQKTVKYPQFLKEDVNLQEGLKETFQYNNNYFLSFY